MTVARHRRLPVVSTPPELLLLSEEDWPGANHEVSWVPAFQRWKEARRAFAASRPDSDLGSVLDQLRFERQVRRDWYS